MSPVLGTIVFFYGGQPFLTGAGSELRSRQPGMMLLIAMAITVAFGASWATTLSIGGFDLDFWWELAALVTIMLLGHWLEMRALGAASNALDALAALLPDTANKVTDDGTVVEVTLAELAVGDVVLVRPGERVPADGTVLSGSAAVDEAMVTGESLPVTRSEGDKVIAGTVATDNALRVTVTAVGDATALAGIQRRVAEAQASSSRAQALADRAAALLFYFAAGVGALTFTVWTLLGDLNEAVIRTVTVLVIACPHALHRGRHAGPAVDRGPPTTRPVCSPSAVSVTSMTPSGSCGGTAAPGRPAGAAVGLRVIRQRGPEPDELCTHQRPVHRCPPGRCGGHARGGHLVPTDTGGTGLSPLAAGGGWRLTVDTEEWAHAAARPGEEALRLGDGAG